MKGDAGKLPSICLHPHFSLDCVFAPREGSDAAICSDARLYAQATLVAAFFSGCRISLRRWIV
jgi:hypothetical protein